MPDFSTEILKGKISLNDYMQFMYAVFNQNKEINKKLDLILVEIAKMKNGVSEGEEVEEGEGNDMIMTMLNNVMNTDPEIKKVFEQFTGN